jgi:hypothetical protein
VIAQFDVNTIWRRKFGDALQRRETSTLLLAPYSFTSRANTTATGHGINRIALPPGWAGRTAALSMPILGHRAKSLAARKGHRIDTAIFTSFHYLRLARTLQSEARIVYYCSDDYRSYSGWGGESSIALEAEMCRLATLSIFVSAALRDRAIAEYRLDPTRCIVAPNATEQRFAETVVRPPAIGALPGPVFGTIGVFNDRIDFDFLEAVAQSPETGSLALVGPVDAALDTNATIKRMRSNPKIHWLGAQPHSEIHAWMAGIDIAVIPYAPTQFNHFCSPMRLWDHLAIGHPIIATGACDQIARQPGIFVTSTRRDELDQNIRDAKAAAAAGRRPHLETWDDRAALIAPWLT